jgi:hypothetical protein
MNRTALSEIPKFAAISDMLIAYVPVSRFTSISFLTPTTDSFSFNRILA